MRIRKTMLAICLGAVSLAFVGCAKGPDVVRVSGVVTYKGKPVPNAYVHFVPAGGDGRPSMGESDAQGRFEMTFDPETKGVLRGKHKVAIEPNPNANLGKDAVPGMPVKVSDEFKDAFTKYSVQKSTFEVDVTSPNSDMKINLE